MTRVLTVINMLLPRYLSITTAITLDSYTRVASMRSLKDIQRDVSGNISLHQRGGG